MRLLDGFTSRTTTSMSARNVARLLVLAALMAPGVSRAAGADRCAIPDQIEAGEVQPPPAAEIHRDVRAASYLLSLSWSPEACLAHPDDADAGVRCRLNSFGFTVHGLWPDGPDKVHPRYCREPTALDPATLRANFCMTPSRWLLQHEWEAHGTCGWATPQAYFAEERKLRTALVVPDLAPGPGGAMTAGAVRRAFLARNPGLARDDLEVDVDRQNRLEEVRVCYDRALKLAPCHGGGGAPDGASVLVAPEPLHAQSRR